MNDPINESGLAALLADAHGHTAVEAPSVLADGSELFFHPDGMTALKVPPLNPKLPDFVTQAETVIEPNSFKAYLIQFKSSTAICRASLGKNQTEAVLDYHGQARVKTDTTDRDAAAPGRGLHVVTLRCPFDPDYAKWKAMLGKLVKQDVLREFVEDMVHTISEPIAADLIEAIADVEIDRAVKFKSARNPRNGTLSFTYTEVDGTGGGTVEMPSEIVVVTPIFQGGPTATFKVQIRYHMDKGELTFKLMIPGIEKEEREAFRSIGEGVRTATNTPVFYTA